MNVLFVFTLLLVEGYEISTNLSNVYLLRCLVKETFQPCDVFTDKGFPEIHFAFSEKLANDFRNLGSDFHNALKVQNLKLIPEEILYKIPDAMLLLLPVNHLSKINGKYLINLIIQRSETKVLKHLVKAYLLENKIVYLCEKLQTVELQSKSLKWVSDVLGSRLHEAEDFVTNVFFVYSPPSVLLNSKIEKLLHLILWEKSNFVSKDINLSSLRIWANAMFKNSFPESLDSWNDLCLERWGILLTALTADELILLKHSNINNFQLLFNFGFSTIQIRSIFDIFPGKLLSSKLNYSSMSYALPRLLPAQLLNFTELIDEETLKVFPSFKSFSTSKQIYELLIVKNKKKGSHFNSYINNFCYVLPLKNLTFYANKTESSALIKIQSNYFSRTQLYILSVGRRMFDFKSESIFECTHFINVLPTRDILFSQIPSHVLLHLLANIAADNIPQSFSVLNKIWSSIGTSTALMKIFSNPSCKILLDYLPSRYIDQFAEPILTSLEKNIGSLYCLSDSFVSALLKSLKKTDNNFNVLSSTKSHSFLINGMSCDEIYSMDSYDLVTFMSMFNEQRKASGKDFPKKLQQCCVDKFLAYIQLKSNLFQRMLGESILSLLNEAEIDSIGGYIFSALPVKAVASAKYSKTIIKSIGELSLSELIAATSLSRLQELGSILVLENFHNKGNIDEILFDLGNLTFFLDKKFLPKISVTFIKLFLESNYYDHRICADESSRAAWFNLLKLSFGETVFWTYQTLVTLGDALIVVPYEELHKIPMKSWIYVADALISRYHEVILLSSSSKKYYEVCMLQLGQSEGELFFEDLIKLTEAFVDAAQLQLNTVSPSILLEKDPVTEVFTNLDTGKSKIKFSIPINRYLINTENPNIKGVQDAKEYNPYFPLNHSDVGNISLYPAFFPEINSTFLHETMNFEQNKYITAIYSMNQSNEVTDIKNNDGYYSSNDLIMGSNNLSSNENEFSSISKMITEPYDISTVFFTSHGTDGAIKGNSSNLTDPSFTSSNYIKFTFGSDLVDYRNSSLSNKSSVLLSGLKVHEKGEDINIADTLDPKDYNNDYLISNSSDWNLTLREKPNFNQSNKSNNLRSNLEDNKFRTILNSNNSKTEFLPLNSSFMNYKLKMNNGVIFRHSNNVRKKRSSQKWTCEALKIVGKLTELLITEEVIAGMTNEQLNECIDLFSEMDLSFQIQTLIWGKLNLEYMFLSGKLISALTISETKNINVSLENPWALEIINLIGKYSNDTKIKQYIIQEIHNTSIKYSVELLVTLGSILCELPQISSQLIEPYEFFKASIVLGKSLPCNHSCLHLLSNIAVEESAFGDPSDWDAGDVSDLGIIISGLNNTFWRKLVYSKKNSLSGMSESAFKCLPSIHMEELVKKSNFKNLLTDLWSPNPFNVSIDFDIFEPDGYFYQEKNGDRSCSARFNDFYFGFIIQTVCNLYLFVYVYNIYSFYLVI